MRRFRRGVAWYGVAAGILLLVVAAASFQLLAARRHLIAGSRYLTAAGVTYRTSPELRRPAVRDRLHRNLVSARQEFARARWNLFVWSPVLHLLGRVPVVGSQLAIASPLTDAALDT